MMLDNVVAWAGENEEEAEFEKTLRIYTIVSLFSMVIHLCVETIV